MADRKKSNLNEAAILYCIHKNEFENWKTGKLETQQSREAGLQRRRKQARTIVKRSNS